MATKTLGEFSSYWFGYCKDTVKQLFSSDQYTRFSEGLLHTLCYETDVGCIPRGIKLDTTKTQPKYFHSENWNKQLDSCYWCRGDSTNYNGICCSKECFFYLHDWCVERVVYYTGRRFCRLPGCVNITTNNRLYCNSTDKAKFDSLFPKGSDHDYIVNTVIREGPSWYNSKENHSQNKLDNKKVSSLPPFESDFPSELQELISQQTDIGIIPRGTFSSFNLQSKFSHYPNWSTTIKGCYSCGRTEIRDSTNTYFCRVRCYLLFYEWCRIKVESVTKIRFCQYASCPKRASEGYPCCNSEHSNGIKKLYEDNSIKDMKRLSVITPKWYIKANCPNELVPHLSSLTNSQTPSEYQQQYQQPNCGPNFVFSSELTQYLYYQTDVGLIPREIRSLRPPPASVPLINWNISITMCYWCCQGHRNVHTVACSHRCLFFFNEWLHKIYETSSHRQLCKHIGCNSLRYSGFQCCNRDHSSSYDSCFKQFYHSLKSTEFALGPVWYTPSINQIEFYNREDPFYEFTNFYLCDVYIYGLKWRTSEHYFQAMKFYGTPYFKYVSTMTSPRDAFQFSRTPEATRWLHPQWPSVKLQVMLNVLRVKFSSHNLRTILLRTGNAMLVEHTRNDKFWGDGGDGRGENRLGILLMQVRREFQTANKYPVYQQNPMFQNNINNQTLLSCEVNNQKSNVVQSGGTNTDQQNFFKNSSPHPSQTNTPPLDSQTNTPSSSLQPSAPPFESSNTNSECISKVSNDPSNTNPFCNQARVGYSKTADVVSKPSSTKPGIYDITSGQKLGYDAKHDLPKNYFNPFDPKDPGSEEIEASQNENSPLLSRNTSNLVDDDNLMETDQTGDSKDNNKPEQSNVQLFAEAQSDSSVFTPTTSHQQCDVYDPFAKHDLPKNYSNPFCQKDPGSEEIEAGQNENSPLLSRNTSNPVDDDTLMETDQTGDSKDKKKPEQSNVQLFAEAQSDSSVLTPTTSHQYDEFNPFAKDL